MKRFLASAWVIARRDYGATVLSPVFLLFLLGPLFPLLFGGIFGRMAEDHDASAPSPVVVAVAADRATTDALMTARRRLAFRLGDAILPVLMPRPAAGEAAERRLLTSPPAGGHGFDAVLAGTLSAPRLLLSSRAPKGLDDMAGLLLDDARAGAPAPVALERRLVPVASPPRPHDRDAVARAGQTLIFFLTVLLASMSLSTFIEEKSNKVIEVMAAAVPVDAIFLGKLTGMLAISFTGVAVWGATGLAAVLLFFPGLVSQLPPPAVGWPLFLLLELLYFASSYVLLGAVFLGLGSQASSPRQVQVMAMPATMGQLILFAFASAGVAHPDGWVARAAAIFPWSSPLAMIARAAQVPTLWTHGLALLWQLLWLVLALGVASRLFRRAVLKSGGRGWLVRPAAGAAS